MSAFPIYHNLNGGAGFPGLSSYSAEQIFSTPMDQPLYDQKAADLAALEHDLMAILGLQSLPVPESLPEIRKEFTAVIRAKVPHPRVSHACDHCRRRKTKCSGEQPVCTSCMKSGKVCEWTPLKTTKERRSRKPYDVEYKPRPHASAPSIVAPRATYPSVMLPNPMTIWSVEDAISASQATTTSNASSGPSTPPPAVKHTAQTLTGWDVPAQYDSDYVDFDSQWIQSSCPSLGSDDSDSSRESSPLNTPTRADSSPSPVHFSGEEAAQNFDDLDTFFKDLYGGLSPDWSSVLQWPEMP
ncbi:uncharacterized protein EDB93DRAFT_1152023 [Suillus bovinus]|uniref:uncharacterized protein n=1 Tax=Suillus bovinus TaxID=48563 RepID=UPI001B85BE3D|nr:uncharacterized protein EDB93DRAFT_1152023 [Suillus bovinus]KAG2145366.1 hypothetical protein EDB93DRAFT_1152023 [Suillus bovinus]